MIFSLCPRGIGLIPIQFSGICYCLRRKIKFLHLSVLRTNILCHLQFGTHQQESTNTVQVICDAGTVTVELIVANTSSDAYMTDLDILTLPFQAVHNAVKGTFCSINRLSTHQSGAAARASAAAYRQEQEYPIICMILSGHQRFDYAQKALKLHCASYVLKPIDKTQLCDEIRHALELKQN